MNKYDLTVTDIDIGVKRILAEAYATASICEKPKIVYITSGPGAGKTSIEVHLKKEFKDQGIKVFDINSDKIAQFHPLYEDALEELPEECYRITRQFVRPATPKVFDELREHKISIINENTLDKGESDIENAKKFKEAGYEISINIMATDILESRLSCFEREANALLMGMQPRGCSKETQNRMYNSFVNEVYELDKLGLLDEINVFTRGENLNKPPVLKYKKGDNKYSNFQEALNAERNIQRKKLLESPETYLARVTAAKNTIANYSLNETLRDNSLKGLEELREDYLEELSKMTELHR